MEKNEIHEYLGRGIFRPPINIKEYLQEIIVARGPITRGELVSATGIPRTTIYDTIVKLMLDGKVQKFSLSNKKRGRPTVYYEKNGEE